MRYPINAPVIITSPYGKQRKFFARGEWHSDIHNGIDFVNQNGDCKVYPVLDGEIIAQEWHYTTGYYSILKHRTSKQVLYSKYCHLSKVNFKVGDTVRQTDCIGVYAKVGLSTGAHLHVSVYNAKWQHFDFNSWLDIDYTKRIGESA